MHVGPVLRGVDLKSAVGWTPGYDAADETDKVAIVYENISDVPMVYFDLAPGYGMLGGIVQIELVARILIPHPDGSVDARFVSCRRLRCSATAATSLRSALDTLLNTPDEGLQPRIVPNGASKMN